MDVLFRVFALIFGLLAECIIQRVEEALYFLYEALNLHVQLDGISVSGFAFTGKLLIHFCLELVQFRVNGLLITREVVRLVGGVFGRAS